MLKKDNGFTLIELLMVIAIITFLVSIVMFSVSGSKKKAEDAKMIQETQSVRTALSLYKSSKGFAPKIGIQGVVYKENQVVDGVNIYKENMQELVDGGYLSDVPQSANGEDYSYEFFDDGEYSLFSADLNNPLTDGGVIGSYNSCEFIVNKNVTVDYKENAVNTSLVAPYIDQFGSGDTFPSVTPANCGVSVCRVTYGTEYCSGLSSEQYCQRYLQDHPGNACVGFPIANFCSIYNRDGDFETTLCGGGGEGFGPYGGTYDTAGYGYGTRAVTCEANVTQVSGEINSKDPVNDSVVCDGLNNKDYCQCVY